MDMEGNFVENGMMENQDVYVSAQTNQTIESLNSPKFGQEFVDAENSAIQSIIPKLVLVHLFQEMRLEFARKFNALIPKVVQELRTQWTQDFKDFIPHMVEEMKLQFAQEFNAHMQNLAEAVHSQSTKDFQAFIPIMVKEVKRMAYSSCSRSPPDEAEPSAPRNLQLHFVGNLPDTLYTDTKITHPLKVELRDRSGNKVEEGSESSAKVRLVVVDGDFDVGRADWTKEEFKRNLAKKRKDKAPLLKGTSEIYLKRGVASITDIAFTDNSKSITTNGTVRLGAELVNGGAREAVSEKAFMVKVRRLLQYYGSSLSLQDNIRPLKHIGDKKAKKLAQEKIHTVKEFLQLYHTDAKALQKVLHISENKLSEAVKIAESCPLTNESYLYKDDREEVELILDCVFNVKAAAFKGQPAQAYDNLDDPQKELVGRLRVQAHKKREELPRIPSLTNCIPQQVEPIDLSAIQPINSPNARANAQNYGIIQTEQPVPRIIIPSSQIPVQVEPIGPPCNQPINNQHAETGAIIQGSFTGEKRVHVNSSVQYLFTHERPNELESQGQAYPDDCDDISSKLYFFQEERTALQASTSNNCVLGEQMVHMNGSVQYSFTHEGPNVGSQWQTYQDDFDDIDWSELYSFQEERTELQASTSNNRVLGSPRSPKARWKLVRIAILIAIKCSVSENQPPGASKRQRRD